MSRELRWAGRRRRINLRATIEKFDKSSILRNV